MLHKLGLLSVITTSMVVWAAPVDEPHCYSRFDYEYKVVQKLVELENARKDQIEVNRDQMERNKDLSTEIENINNTSQSHIRALENALKNALKEQSEINMKLKIDVEEANNKSVELQAEIDSLRYSYDLNKDIQIGFSAQGNTISSASVLQFSSVKTNVGSRYSSSTGVFTCNHPGLYFFALSLIKKRAESDTDQVYCYLRKNGVNQIYTRIDPNDKYADYGSYGTSTFFVVHLSSGDNVDVSGCSSESTIDAYSTFSGFLLKSDLV